MQQNCRDIGSLFEEYARCPPSGLLARFPQLDIEEGLDRLQERYALEVYYVHRLQSGQVPPHDEIQDPELRRALQHRNRSAGKKGREPEIHRWALQGRVSKIDFHRALIRFIKSTMRRRVARRKLLQPMPGRALPCDRLAQPQQEERLSCEAIQAVVDGVLRSASDRNARSFVAYLGKEPQNGGDRRGIEFADSKERDRERKRVSAIREQIKISLRRMGYALVLPILVLRRMAAACNRILLGVSAHVGLKAAGSVALIALASVTSGILAISGGVQSRRATKAPAAQPRCTDQDAQVRHPVPLGVIQTGLGFSVQAAQTSAPEKRADATKQIHRRTKPSLSTQFAREIAQRKGVLGLLLSGDPSLSSIFGRDSTLGSEASDVLGDLRSTGIGDSFAAPPAGLVQTSRPGGASENLIAPPAFRKQAVGTKWVPEFPRQSRYRFESPMAIDFLKAYAKDYVRRHRHLLKSCYDKTNPDRWLVETSYDDFFPSPLRRKGRIVLRLTYGLPTHHVGVSIIESTLNNPATEACILQVASGWTSSMPGGSVDLPITFR